MESTDRIIGLLKDAPEYVDSEAHYTHNGMTVPRVTKILQKCIHSDSLMYWANSLGFKRMSYKRTMNEASNIGTFAHNMIDNHLDGKEDDEDMLDDAPEESIIAYTAFLAWFDNLKSVANVKVIFHEKPITCPYFGGTLDGLYEINGKVYLVDYKTSNHVTFKYCLQLAAYIYILTTEYKIKVDGCIILQLNKYRMHYTEYVMNFDNPHHLKYINECTQAFLSMVYAYYNIEHIERTYSALDWEAK